MSDKRTKRTESAMTEWKALIAEAKGDDWGSREVLLAADRVVRASKPIAAWFKASGETRLPKEVAERFVKAVEAMERKGE